MTKYVMNTVASNCQLKFGFGIVKVFSSEGMKS